MVGSVEQREVVMDDRTEKADRASLQKVVAILAIAAVPVGKHLIAA
jgi:hypothetical protein